MHVLVHGREKGGKSVPHDHGPCWVIYGNYKNPTRMRRWRRLDDGSKPRLRRGRGLSATS